MENNYINIIRLFDHCNIDVERLPIETSRALKIIKAEFAASPNGLLTIGDYVYTMQGVVKLFEQPNFEQIIIWEKEIYENEFVNGILEFNGTRNLEQVSSDENLSNLDSKYHNYQWPNFYKVLKALVSDEFINYYSLYLSYAMSGVVRRCLVKNDHENTMGSFGIIAYIKSEHRELALQPFRLFFVDSINIIKNTNQENINLSLKRLQHFVVQGWYKYFNRLPPELIELRYDLIKSLMSLFSFNKKIAWHSDLIAIERQLIQLKGLDEELLSEIYYIHDLINYEIVSKSSKRLFIKRTFIIIILMLLLIYVLALLGL